MLPAGDAQLIQIMDAALADAKLRGGEWLACKPGCNQCCTGVFRISALDAERLWTGLQELQRTDKEEADRVLHRVEVAQQRLASTFPGDAHTGLLAQGDAALQDFDDFADDEVCPVLDPLAGTCALYRHRPMTCRTFGPPVRTEGGDLGVCELCFVGASQEVVERGELHLPDPALEENLLHQTGHTGETIVAFAFNRFR